ncbi:GntP family permease [Corynebacterium sp. sy039]|uniref:GntP family permease n=1 Tax=Corynebacterium sp. sy039 TaxID=2599641 RepID=UPI0011B707C7|nr:GntP family permease [Corynebacterium sp. sy039]QDZ41769.1 GntP family permease [Corynebacterium sp. sy039]
MVIAFIGVLLSLILLVTLAYRGHSVIVVAPLAAALALLFSGQPLLASYTQIFMPALGGFVTKYFPLFLFGAIFGHLMTTTGLAQYLARGITALLGTKRAIFSTVLASALLTYGGVSAWVVAFTIVPIATALFQETGIPIRLMPAAIALGSFTFGIAALPGTPQIHNAIPTTYFGTNTYAAPVLGLVASALMLVLGLFWLEFRVKQLHSRGEFFVPLDAQGKAIALPHISDDSTPDAPATTSGDASEAEEPSVRMQGVLGLIPIAVVVLVNFSFVYGFSRWLDTDYLGQEKFGNTSIEALLGIWSPTISLLAAIVVIIVMFPKKSAETLSQCTQGAKNAVVPCLTTASEVGFGAVIASLAVFALIKGNMLDLSDNALIVGVISTAVISGITGSSSGGLSITMQTLGEQLAQLAHEQGISMELMHRVIAMASVSFDSLPHNGAVLTLLIVCGMTHRLSYKDIAVCTIAIPIVGLGAIVALGALL